MNRIYAIVEDDLYGTSFQIIKASSDKKIAERFLSLSNQPEYYLEEIELFDDQYSFILDDKECFSLFVNISGLFNWKVGKVLKEPTVSITKEKINPLNHFDSNVFFEEERFKEKEWDERFFQLTFKFPLPIDSKSHPLYIEIWEKNAKLVFKNIAELYSPTKDIEKHLDEQMRLEVERVNKIVSKNC